MKHLLSGFAAFPLSLRAARCALGEGNTVFAAGWPLLGCPGRVCAISICREMALKRYRRLKKESLKRLISKRLELFFP